MKDKAVRNAIIDSTFLGIEDHGFFGFALGFRYGEYSQGTGVIGLGTPGRDDTWWVHGTEVLATVISLAGVESWEELKSQPIRAFCSTDRILAIGHYLEDRWLSFTGTEDERFRTRTLAELREVAS